ncbi:HPP family protein [Halovenus aranensis]|uniref:HPP family protein n=1 Tax=Halovenus aranensis TaxID=890420 RepID=A0A1G8Y386_9EURY|nr:HPP family protein [Halovenus aranensis]SDJ97298.1 HPP family protein [Halovenus aranensis]
MGRRLQSILSRVRQAQHRESRDLRRWLERTNTVVHLSILFVVPLLVALVTALSNRVGPLSFLVYPPLASGAYTLFANPEGRYASPLRFVGGLTVGATCGWVAVEVTSRLLYTTPANEVNATAAALTIFITGLATWLFGVEQPSAFAMALVTLFVHTRVAHPLFFVFSAALSSAIVAVGFEGWRRYLYEQRAHYLYETTSGDDRVLVPMRGPNPGATAMLAARLAAAHRAGKVVLLDVVDQEWMARAERSLLEDHGSTKLVKTGPVLEGEPTAEGPDGEMGPREAVSESVATLERQATRIETQVDVPCQVVVAASGSTLGSTVLQTASQANCDLVVSPAASDFGSVTQFTRELFQGDVDVLLHQSEGGRTRWRRVLVPVREAGGVAHNMVDFATRLTGDTGEVSVGACVSGKRERRQAEEMLADIVEPFDGTIETRVSQSSVETFLDRHAHEYDLVLIGASQDRSVASRLLSPPTFERIDDGLDTDVGVVDRH